MLVCPLQCIRWSQAFNLALGWALIGFMKKPRNCQDKWGDISTIYSKKLKRILNMQHMTPSVWNISAFTNVQHVKLYIINASFSVKKPFIWTLQTHSSFMVRIEKSMWTGASSSESWLGLIKTFCMQAHCMGLILKNNGPFWSQPQNLKLTKFETQFCGWLSNDDLQMTFKSQPQNHFC